MADLAAFVLFFSWPPPLVRRAGRVFFESHPGSGWSLGCDSPGPGSSSLGRGMEFATATLTRAADEAAAISEQVDQLQRRALNLEREIARSRELILNANSWRHSVPFFWEDPVIHTAHWVRYWEEYPMPTQEPVNYCRDRFCERLMYLGNDHLVWPEPGWEWLIGREHVWTPCARCLARERAEAARLATLETQRLLVHGPGRGEARPRRAVPKAQPAIPILPRPRRTATPQAGFQNNAIRP